MKDLEPLCHTVDDYYLEQHEKYKNFRHLLCKDEKIVVSDEEILSSVKPDTAQITSVDFISDKLCCVKATYASASKHYQDVLGLIFVQNSWQIMCAITAEEKYRFANLYEQDFSQQLAEEKQIGEVLLRYCHDVYIMDAPDCLSLFWDKARMYHPNADDSFTDVAIQILNQRWENMPDPVSLGIEEFSRIHFIEMLNHETAIAKVGCAKLDNYFRDYLWLMKLNGQWLIVNKMTHGLYTGEKI